MSTALHRVEVPSSVCEEYVRRVLGDSRRSLGEALKANVHLGEGKVFTWIPSDKSLPQDLSRGGLFPEPPESTWRRGRDAVAKPVVDAWALLADEVEAFVSKDTRHVCLLANEVVDVGDPVAANYPAAVAYGNELYHLITRATPKEQIPRILTVAKSVPVFVGVLSAADISPERKLELDRASLVQIVARLDGIVVGAFDGEGFLLWMRWARD
jgi:hypothetical protein